MKDFVILVDQFDNERGTMEKLEAHLKNELHRAFSVFIFNSKGEMLIHQRALEKYHSPGLWTNACCSHPAPGENLENAIKRRLREELNMSVSVEHLFKFHYQANFDNGLSEHEMDHVFIGFSDEAPIPNPEEVEDFNYVSADYLEKDIKKNPNDYTEWFKICYLKVIDQYQRNYSSFKKVG